MPRLKLNPLTGTLDVVNNPVAGGQDRRTIRNDLTSLTANNVPLLPFALVSGGLSIQNQSHLHAISQARTVLTFRPSSSNANSGVRFVSKFGAALGKGSRTTVVMKLIDQGSEAENDTFNITIGQVASSFNNTIGNAGAIIKVENGEIYRSSRGENALPADTSTPVPFTSYGVWIKFELEHLEDDSIRFSATNIETDAVIWEDTYTDVDKVPNYTNQGSGAQTYAHASCYKTTTGTIDFVVYDLVEFTTE